MSELPAVYCLGVPPKCWLCSAVDVDVICGRAIVFLTWLALAVVRFMEDCIARVVSGVCVFCFTALVIRDCMWLFPTVVYLIAGNSVVLYWCALWFLTLPCGCWLCSPSLPGGNQVDGLPPAPSTGEGVIGPSVGW